MELKLTVRAPQQCFDTVIITVAAVGEGVNFSKYRLFIEPIFLPDYSHTPSSLPQRIWAAQILEMFHDTFCPPFASPFPISDSGLQCVSLYICLSYYF